MDHETPIPDVVSKKKFLKRYSRISKKIERLEEKLYTLDSRLTSPQTQKSTGMPRGAQPLTMADLVADKIETEERINQLAVLASLIRKEILLAIDTLEDYRQVEVLEKFFIEGKPLEVIADELGYTVRHTVRFYAQGIEQLDLK